MSTEKQQYETAMKQLADAAPFEALVGFFVGRLNSLDARLGMLFKKLRSNATLHKELPEVVDAESAEKREALIQMLGKIIVAKGDIGRRDDTVKEFYALYFDYCIFRTLLPKLIALQPKKKEEEEEKKEEKSNEEEKESDEAPLLEEDDADDDGDSRSIPSEVTKEEQGNGDEDKKGETLPPSTSETEEEQCPPPSQSQQPAPRRSSRRIAAKKQGGKK